MLTFPLLILGDLLVVMPVYALYGGGFLLVHTAIAILTQHTTMQGISKPAAVSVNGELAPPHLPQKSHSRINVTSAHPVRIN